MRKLEEVLEDWEAVIGLEIHAELTTLDTKMFCGCKLEFGAEPNTHTCPVCLGMPGALPVPNRAAIESIVLAGLATNCDIEKHSMFYRKTYMYPDMSKNYQTTQGPVAFCMRGHLDLDVDGAAAKERIDLDGLDVGESRGNVTRTETGYTAHVGITRIHMEEDAGKMVHIGGGEGRIAGAGIDVFEVEPPLDVNHPLLHSKNTIVTPHVAFASAESMEARCHIVFDNITKWLAGEQVNVIL